MVGNSRQSQTRLHASNRAALLAAYAEGVPVKELASLFGAHRATDSEVAQPAGLPSRMPGLPEQTRPEAARHYTAGVTLP